MNYKSPHELQVSPWTTNLRVFEAKGLVKGVGTTMCEPMYACVCEN